MESYQNWHRVDVDLDVDLDIINSKRDHSI